MRLYVCVCVCVCVCSSSSSVAIGVSGGEEEVVWGRRAVSIFAMLDLIPLVRNDVL